MISGSSLGMCPRASWDVPSTHKDAPFDISHHQMKKILSSFNISLYCFDEPLSENLKYTHCFLMFAVHRSHYKLNARSVQQMAVLLILKLVMLILILILALYFLLYLYLYLYLCLYLNVRLCFPAPIFILYCINSYTNQ